MLHEKGGRESIVGAQVGGDGAQVGPDPIGIKEKAGGIEQEPGHAQPGEDAPAFGGIRAEEDEQPEQESHFPFHGGDGQQEARELIVEIAHGHQRADQRQRQQNGKRSVGEGDQAVVPRQREGQQEEHERALRFPVREAQGEGGEQEQPEFGKSHPNRARPNGVREERKGEK